MTQIPPVRRPGTLRWLGWVARWLGHAVATGAGRATARTRRRLAAWGRRPTGRFALALLALIAVVAVSATAGGLGGRALAPDRGRRTATPQTTVPATANPPVGPLPTSGAPTPPPSNQPVQVGAAPQLALAGWAGRVSPVVGISVTALQAYGYAQLALAQSDPACHLSWTTLAAIGKVESNHGTASGATLSADGEALPPIIGPALDGRSGLKLVPDTDGGALDGDPVYDHAVGPMQFLPSTWRIYAIDANADGSADPNDINDAALAAADYLCAGGHDLATPSGWWGAVLAYNNVQPYAQDVFTAANVYGTRSRSVT